MAKTKVLHILKLLSIPITLLVLSGIISIIWSIFKLPSDTELMIIIKNWFNHYGLWVVFISALIEGVLLFGNYYPGGLVIFLGVISVSGNTSKVILVTSVVCAALFIAYIINYMLGKYGWYTLLVKFGMRQSIENTKIKLERHQFKAIFGSYWFPNLASITATAAGVLYMPFKKFLLYSGISVLLWNSFWGALVGTLGEKALSLMSFKVVLIVIAIWVLVVVVKERAYLSKSRLSM
jgi:membrane protein DedA with SNARE-associated domain